MSNQRLYLAILFSASLIALITFLLIFQVSMETIPIDFGWLGLLFIFINGFFLSLVLNSNKIGSIERLLLSTGLGFGLAFTVMIILGILGNLSFLTVVFSQILIFTSLFLILAIKGRLHFHLRPDNYSLSLDNKTQTNVKQKILILAISILAIFALYKTLFLPAIEWDSLAYGVNYAKIIFQNGNIPLIAGPSIGLEMSASYPPGIQLTAVFLYLFSGGVNDFYYRLLSPIFGLATILGVYKFSMLLSKNKTNSIYAVALLCIIPFFWEVFIQETYLMALTFMLITSAFFFYKAYNSSPPYETRKYELIGILFCSFAALTSYTGLFSFGILLLYAINKKVTMKRFIGLIVLAFVIIFPWYLRNLILLGNPIYPFFGIGKYLDPLLRSSTIQHFQQYSSLPYYGIANLLCILGIVILAISISYLSFSKRRDFRFVLPYYLLFVFLLIMVVHVIFPRYLILALPSIFVICSSAINFIDPSRFKKLKTIFPWILLSLIIVSSTLMVPYMDTIKPNCQPEDDKTAYLSHVFAEGDAWQWINENTSKDARIATFDIKEYYIERDIFPLDGNESVTLYQMETIEECIDFLQERGVSYLLSVPWASLGDVRVPPAYLLCPLTSYFGDDDYLPTVFIGGNGTAVYHIGPLAENPIYQVFAEKNMIFPIKHIAFNFTMTNNTYLYGYQFYLPIPVDYRNGTMTIFINSSNPLVVELWSDLISTDEIIERSANSEPIIKWQIEPSNSSSTKNPSFTWQPIDKAGYFTFRILGEEKNLKNEFDVIVNIRFYNYFGK